MAYDEFCRVIREVDPPKPSTRISTMGGERATEVAHQRHTEPGVLGRLMRGDLDWIAMKALEKDRTRRYETASAFAEDIQRHLAQEPVLAGPPTAAYRLRKFLRRNRFAVTVGTIIVVSVVTGVTLAIVGLSEASEEHRRAAEESEARLAAEQATQAERIRTEVEKQAKEAEAKLRQEEQRWGHLSEARSLMENGRYLFALQRLCEACKVRHDHATRLLAWVLASRFRSRPIRSWTTVAEVLFIGFHPDDGTVVTCGRGNPGWVDPDGTYVGYGPGHGPGSAVAPLESRAGVRALYGFYYNCFALSPDGGIVASGGWPDEIILWDTATGIRLKSIKSPTGQVASIAFSSDGTRLATGTYNDPTVTLWDVATGNPLATLGGGKSSTVSVAFSPDGRTLAAGSSGSGQIVLWDVEAPAASRVLTGHTRQVRGLAFSPDGAVLASASWDTTVRLWDVSSGREVWVLSGHEDWATAVAFSPEGGLLATGGRDESIKLWDVAEQRELRSLDGQTGMVSSLAFSADGKTLGSASRDGTTRLWSVETGDLARELPVQSGGVSSMAYSPDGTVLAMGAGETVFLRDASSGDVLKTFTGVSAPLGSIAFSPDGRLLGAGTYSPVLLWDLATGQQLPSLKGHTGTVTSIAFSPDGSLLVSGSVDKSIRLWDPHTGVPVRTLSEHGSEVLDVAFSPDGSLFASASRDGTARVWDAASGRVLHTLSDHNAAVLSVAFSPSGDLLASGGEDRTIRLWDPATGSQSRKIPTRHLKGVWHLEFSSDGVRLASGSDNVMLWDVETGHLLCEIQAPGARNLALSPDGERLACGGSVEVWVCDATAPSGLRVLAGHAAPVRAVALSQNGMTLASGDADGFVKLWDGAAGTDPRVQALPVRDPVEALAFSPDQSALAIAGSHASVTLLHLDTGETRFELGGHVQPVRSLTFSPDGRYLASGDGKGTVRIWDVRSGSELRALGWGGFAQVTSIAFSPDGRNLAASSWNETVRLWDTESGQQLGEFAAGSVYRIVFSPDGQLLVAAAYDFFVQWSVQEGRVARVYRGHPTGVGGVAFSPDGQFLASTGFDDTLRLWDTASGREIATMRPPSGDPRAVLFTPDGGSLICSDDQDILIYDLHAYDEQIERWLTEAAQD
jgi:WD40 repeat protein